MVRRDGSQPDYLTHVDDDYIDCRVFGHRFSDIGDFIDGHFVYLVMQCERCDSYAIVEWHRDAGTNSPRKYKYAPGYLNTTGVPFSKDDARLEKISRTKFASSKEFDKLMKSIDHEMES
jgi:hypothetical protein